MRSPRLTAILLSSICLIGSTAPLCGCRGARFAAPARADSQVVNASTRAPRVTDVPVRFRDIASQAGIHFRLDNGARGNHTFVETTTGGCALFDYDNDGYLDVFLIQAGTAPGYTVTGPRPPCALYHNNGNGTFSDVTAQAGLAFDQGYAQGVAVADYDNDGWEDLYITAYGGNHLLHNDHGRFRDVTQSAGLADNAHGARWATSAAWADYNRDGFVDLLVCHYALWRPSTDIACQNARNTRSYCSPDLYRPETPSLYRNNGNGTFTDVTAAAGLSRLKGRDLGVAWLDFNADGYPDVFVSNDLMPNFLLRNNGNGTFNDVSSEAGVNVMDTGVPLAGMGIGVADYEDTGREGILVTNFSNQPKEVYRNINGRLFENVTYSSGIGSTTQLVLGWGCEFLDYDLDGYKDIVVGNGHVNDDVEAYSQGVFYREPKQLFHNQHGGVFAEDSASLGDMTLPSTTRGLAVGDIDNDGAPDVLANSHNMPAQLFHNEGGAANGWITFRTVGTRSNRDGIGAKIWVTCGPLHQYAEVRSGSSYASHSDQRVTFGLGKARRIDSVRVRWPSGVEETARGLAARRFYVLTEGRGVSRDPRARPWRGRQPEGGLQ